MDTKFVAPLLSIIVANYNYGRFLEEALCSIFSQCVEWEKIRSGEQVNSLTLSCGASIEVIVCDAASKDESVSILEKYSNILCGIRFSEGDKRLDNSSFLWCSEKDRGQSHAFNKGFTLAQGRLGCWLNADDVFVPGSLDSVAKYALNHPNADWITGGCIFLNADGTIRKCSPNVNFPTWLYSCLPEYIVGGPSTFFDIKLFQDVGGFDEELYYVMDCDLWRRFMLKRIGLHAIKNYVWTFRLHEDSKTSSIVLTGEVSDKRRNESRRVGARYSMRFSTKIRQKIYLLVKMSKGGYIRSFFDSKRFRGCHLKDIKGDI